MKTALFAYSRQGCRTARRMIDFFSNGSVRAYTMERFQENGFEVLPKPSRHLYGELFQWADAMIFVGAAGIAVREIAPFVWDKRTDPAVISVDELGRFVVPLLSGHIGGANELALKLADFLGAEPVITTATDINGKFSVDAWAAKQGLFMDSIGTAKAVSAEILERSVPLFSDFPIIGKLPTGVTAGSTGKIGICISCCRKNPFERTLLLVPPVVRLGIGCRRGTSAQAIKGAVETVLSENNIHPKAVKSVSSIDLKANEEGFLEFCQEKGITPSFYTAEELKAVPGKFTAAECVLWATGVENVCERAAMIGAKELLVKKTICNHVTVAAAAESWEVCFE